MRNLKTMDGNTATAHVAYAFSEVAAIYPITPSSTMAENIDRWATENRKNIFGQKVHVVEMQSEGGAAGAVHGSVAAGALTSTFTASQGLLLMIPNMYKLAGEQTPAVLHVAARALTTHALSIFGDHSDVMSCRQTGFAMLCSNSVQECMDLAAVAHLSAIAGKVPMMHFFDGFRTSHEYQKIEAWDYEELKEMADWDAIRDFRKRVSHPMHPYNMGSSESPEVFFQHRESCNRFYDETVEIVAGYMDEVNRRTGTDYAPFNYYGDPDATDVVVAMGSVCDTIEEVIDYLNASGRKTGLIKVRLYRPFSTEYLKKALPQSVKRIAVLDRCKEPGSIGEPLYLDIALALADTDIKIIGGRYGLGSKDTQPGDIVAVFDNLASKEPKQRFTVSIDDDVTNLSIKASSNPDTAAAGTVSCKFWGLGADGTVGANKNSVKIIGDNTDKKVQAYFQYDSKKSGGITISHLRFGDKPIKSTYYVKQADFVACHNPSYLNKYNMVEDVKKGGIFLLNCSWSNEELEKHLPAHVKKYIASNDIQFYTCDAVTIARELGLGGRTNTVLQAAFFKLADIIPIDKAAVYMKEAIKKTYGNKGEKVVNMNCAAVDAGIANVVKVEVPESWKNASDSSRKQRIKGRDKALTDYVENILMPTNAMDGDSIPVSKFVSTADGSVPSGTAAYEKRGIAYAVPKWDSTKCMQCNWCSYVCPHAAIRPFVLKPECECDEAVKMRGDSNLKFIVAVSAMDCTGCGSCANVCPSRHKALEMVPAEEIAEKEQKLFDYVFEHADYDSAPYDDSSVRGSQFRQPLLEFSGACPGCGETPYAKLVTQLFGDRMYIANATGCSSIWGCSAPSTPYTVNAQGRGPAWANSLFEDNAEFGFGMAISVKVRRNELKAEVEKLAENPVFEEAANNWLDNMNNAAKAEEYGQKLVKLCEQSSNKSAIYVVENQDMLIKPSMWILGGDGWAYDIGYGGLDHVLATGENVNILVFDTEVYSNTGGQASKSTPIGAVAQFASNGKSVKKKDLAQEAMSYGYVYVAQIAMGANPAQALTAIKEAESYDGPSLIIAYAPCINHGLKAGMDKAMLEMKNAVRSGYWNLLRYDPRKREAGVNPLSIDNPKPTEKYRDFIMGEVRYNSLMLKDPDRAEKLFTRAEKIASQKYDDLVNQKRSFDPEEEV